jgi:gamma-glutamyltranspeptidase
MWPDWSKAAGSVGAIRIDPVHGVLHGAADSRRMAYAIGR